MRSNLSVGMPIDLFGDQKDSLRVTLKRVLPKAIRTLRDISQFWSAGLRKVFGEAPDLSWG
jgi:putative proteasome-type protease